MKKRGHKPSAQTITIMLRGYMENVKMSKSVQQALSVYNSMFAPNSTVKPSIIHTNAILTVCGKAGDMESLWGIAGRLPERGPDAADRRTYTTILMSITEDARSRALKLGSKEQQFHPDERGLDTDKIFEQAIEDGRRLWTEVIARWRRGHLEIDAKLTCAMGRLLMLSSQRKHHQEIFALVDQTMNLNRLEESPESAKKEMPPPTKADSEPTNVLGAKEPSLREGTPENGEMSIAREVSSSGQVPSKALNSAYAVPDNNTLSMLLETALSLKSAQKGRVYWDLITSSSGPYKLQPDSGTFALYLRLLRLLRASQASLDILKSIPETMWKSNMAFKGVFIIAMSTCVRDKNNPNAFDTACRLIDFMQEKAENYGFHQENLRNYRTAATLSPKVLTLYVQLAMATTRGINGEKLTMDVKTGDLNFERDPRKNNLLRALQRLTPDTLNVKRLIKLNVAEYERQLNEKSRTPRVQSRLRGLAEAPDNTQELVDYLTTLIGAYDKLLLVNEKLEDEGLGPLSSQILTDCVREKRKLSAFVGMVNNVPGIASRYEKIKDFLEPLEKEDEEQREESSHAFKPSALIKLRQDLEQLSDEREKRKLLRGLSIRQKREFQKGLHARSGDPTRERSLDAEEIGRGTTSSHTKAPMRLARPRDNGSYAASKSATLPKFPATKKSHPSGFRDDGTTNRPPRRSESTRKAKSSYTNLPSVEGWGGGFSELAKKQGQSSSGFVDLGS